MYRIIFVHWTLVCTCGPGLIGCGPIGGEVECDPPVTTARVPVENASLANWMRPDMRGFRIVLAETPYRVSDYAVERCLSCVEELAEMARLRDLPPQPLTAVDGGPEPVEPLGEPAEPQTPEVTEVRAECRQLGD